MVSILVGGIPTPLKNHGLRQLGLLFPICGKTKFMFQTTKQYSSRDFGDVSIKDSVVTLQSNVKMEV